MDGISISYLGQCGFVISGKDVRIVTDPYLSYSIDRDHYSEKTPWKRLYPPPCTLAYTEPDYVIISHGHDDHLNPDTIKDYLASGGDASFIAPAPICYMLSELGVRPERIIPAYAEGLLELKGCSVLPIPCAHTELHTDTYGSFFELSYIIRLDKSAKSVFFGGDMSLYNGLTERLAREELSILLLPCNGRDEYRTANGIIGNIDENEAAQLSAALKVPFMPMHHDLYEINSCSEEKIISAVERFGARMILPKLIDQT